jgi:glycosyltransferase involved in cell wall biosynthesis
MRWGLIARKDRTGLGYQTKAIYEHLKPNKTLVLDISMHNGQEQIDGWYQGEYHVKDFPKKDTIQRFLSGLDLVFTCETPYNYELFAIAKAMGVKTVNQYNPEFFDYFLHDYPKPDLLLAPSLWKFKEVDNWAKANNVKHKYLHLPVDREQFKFKLRTTKKMFHVAGKPAEHDRNGTWDFMMAVPNGIVITQKEALAKEIRTRYRHSNVFTGISNPETIYNFGDVMIMPRRYGGNCLPLNEALSSGCPVIMPDIEPNNSLLPEHWLVPAYIVGQFEPRTKVDLYSVDPKALADKVNEIRNDWDMAKESQLANEIAEKISWNALKVEYIKTLEDLCKS